MTGTSRLDTFWHQRFHPSLPPSLPPLHSELGEWAGSEDEEEDEEAYLIKEDDNLPFACFLCREGEGGREGGRYKQTCLIFVPHHSALSPSLPQASAIRW